MMPSSTRAAGSLSATATRIVTTALESATSTSSAPTGSHTSSSNNADSSSPTSSPLLFFVALGFGVVFTNLWIIVGVKYCFRYNQRNRRLHDANGDPIDLGAMQRPHRRRREKRLMTMEEVSERFPLMKYQTWRKTREQDGLPAAGGITAPPSRAGSVKEAGAAGAAGDSRDSRDSTDSHRSSTALSQAQKDHAEAVEAPRKSESPETAEPRTSEDGTSEKDDLTKAETSTSTAATQHAHEPQPSAIPETRGRADAPHTPGTDDDGDDDDDDDPIAGAAPPELLPSPGDTCAICLDTLEDDDDVRGLTCGHAFHSGCVDPWLTSRRACCPLCKADYYTPKPRADGEENERPRGILPAVQPAWMAGRPSRMPSRPRMMLVGPRVLMERPGGFGSGFASRSNPNREGRRSGDAPNSPGAQQQSGGWRSVMPNVSMPSMPRMPTVALSNPFRRGQAQANGESSQPSPQPTPSQLEAGSRS